MTGSVQHPSFINNPFKSISSFGGTLAGKSSSIQMKSSVCAENEKIMGQKENGCEQALTLSSKHKGLPDILKVKCSNF